MNKTHAVVIHKVFLFILLIGFCPIPTKSQKEVKQDSIELLLVNNPEDDSLRVAILIALADSYKNLDPITSSNYLFEAFEIAKKKEYSFQKAIIQRALIQYFSLEGNIEEAIKNGIAAIKTFDSLNSKDQMLITQSMLIPIFNSEGYYDKALDMSLKSLEQVIDDPESPGKGRYYFNVGNSYRYLGQYENALEYYQEALDISNRANFTAGQAVVSVNIASCKIEMGYLEEARLILETELVYFEKSKNLSVTAEVLSHLGRIAAKQWENRLSIRYFEESIEIYRKLGFIQNIADISERLFIQYSIVGDVNKAQLAEVDSKLLKDSLRSEEINKIVGDLQAKYESEQKEAEITFLKQQSEIQNLQIRQRNQAILIGILIFISILTIIYFITRQRNDNKLRKQIELEQRFLRSQLNPHFISNALVAVQSSLLEKNTEEANNYLGTFSRLMREILENSRSELITLDAELEMLTDYLEINKRRLNHSFEYQIEVDEAISQEMDMIPPMLIQPFVENAIEHGLHPDEEGRIWINFAKKNEGLNVKVKDNGIGLNHENENQKNHDSLSTTIIEERIQLLNQSQKNQIKLLIDNWFDSSGKVAGTLVELDIPIH